VYVYGGTFTMSGGTISDNAAVNNGGGVYMSGGTLTLSGGTISDNTATKNGGGVYVGGGTFIMNGSAAVTADNDVYLVSGKKITVNGAMSGGGAQNITHAVTTAGTIVVSVDYSGGTAKSVKQYFKLNSLLASEQRIGLTAEGNDLKIGALVPEVDDPTVFVTPYTSTVANVSFNLTTASGATKVYVNLTPVSGGTPIATQYTGTISPGMGVVNHQVPGLTAGTAYTLNITPWNDTTEGTLFTTTYTAPSPVYTVTVQNDGHGTGSASPAGGVAGTAITLTSSPASGYQFKAWQVVQGSVSVSGNTFPMPAENVILKALFEPQTTPTPAPTQPRPPSSGDGGGFSSTDSGSVSATGQVSFGTTTGVTRISFAPGTSGTVTIDTKPTGVTPPPDSYIVIDITGPAFKGYAQIEFSVPVALLTDRGLTVYDVSLRHFIGGKWVTLRTHYLGQERGAANYIAATQTFSPFAIVYEKGGAEIIESATPEPTGSTTARPTVQETSGDLRPASGVQNTPAATTAAPDGGTPVPTLTQAPAPVFGALAGLLAAGVLFRRRE
ncbi:MAG: PGF-pre-PGF domain-containing protein, partial [Methanocorpusculum sp.]|nr:PGF-pre-PGF domain-containing protein [Methanocorpusculum sp.]